MKAIERSLTVEDLVTRHPRAVTLLMDQNIPCLVCGEPVWGTLEEVAREGGKSEREINRLVEEMNQVLIRGTKR